MLNLEPVVESLEPTARIYPYTAGGAGTSIAVYLAGKGKLAPAPAPQVFHEGAGEAIHAIPPSAFSYYELLNDGTWKLPDVELVK